MITTSSSLRPLPRRAHATYPIQRWMTHLSTMSSTVRAEGLVTGNALPIPSARPAISQNSMPSDSRSRCIKRGRQILGSVFPPGQLSERR